MISLVQKEKVKLVIDGMTGVGKSSLVELVSWKMNLFPFEEIFEDPNQLLQKFFRDRHKWAFPMQVNFLNNRFRQYRQASAIENAVMDRSIYSDDIFARMYLHLGYFTPEEYDVYRNLLETMLEQIFPPLLMVYLKVNTGEAIRRIRQRGRPEELEVEASYWARLNEFYDDHYRNYEGKLLTIDVSNKDFVNNKDHQEEVLSLVVERCHNTRQAET